MKYSKHNIFSKITDSENYFLVNPLSGQADILEPDEAQKYIDNTITDRQIYIDKGYLVDQKEEEKVFKQKYLDFIDERDSDEVQLFFTPWYTCNFSCSYCFQDEYTNANDNVSKDVTDAFFDYVSTRFASRKKYVTIFGGEPLLNSPSKKETIKYIIQKANEYSLDLAFVTNGYYLEEYIDLLKTANIREIQVTMDGPQSVHDTRRMLRGGSGSFEKIAKGVDSLLENSIPVNLRMIVDKDNIGSMPEFAQWAIARGWTKSPFFKTALGRNYELHHCQTNNKRLFSRIEMYQELYKIIKAHPEVLEFHKPALSISKFIFENGELPNPLFDSCSGAKTEWAFDYSGKIYSCTATVGHDGDELGTFFPNVELKEEAVELRFGQRIGAFLLDGVLRGQNMEGPPQRPVLPRYRHLPLLHRLQECGLGSRAGPVYLVCHEQLAEDRAFDEAECPASIRPGIEHLRAQDVRGHQVGRELDAVPLEAHDRRKRVDKPRLAKSGEADQQCMAATKHGCKHKLHHLLLADETAVDACLGIGQLLPQRFDFGNQCLWLGHDNHPRQVICSI